MTDSRGAPSGVSVCVWRAHGTVAPYLPACVRACVRACAIWLTAQQRVWMESSQSSNADAAAYREVYDVRHQREGNNDHIHDMSFSSAFIWGICWVLCLLLSHNVSTLPKVSLCFGGFVWKGSTSFCLIRCRSAASRVASRLHLECAQFYTVSL